MRDEERDRQDSCPRNTLSSTATYLLAAQLWDLNSSQQHHQLGPRFPHMSLLGAVSCEEEQTATHNIYRTARAEWHQPRRSLLHHTCLHSSQQIQLLHTEHRHKFITWLTRSRNVKMKIYKKWKKETPLQLRQQKSQSQHRRSTKIQPNWDWRRLSCHLWPLSPPVAYWKANYL